MRSRVELPLVYDRKPVASSLGNLAWKVGETPVGGEHALPIDETDALHLATLPPIHKDPFDRLIVSQAICHGLTILTPDPLIHSYPARWEW